MPSLQLCQQILFASLFAPSVLAHGYNEHPYQKTRPAYTRPISDTSTSSCGYSGGGPTATIDIGVLHGTSTSLPAATASVNQFFGVPFAKSPPERFSPPEAPAQLSNPINATAWSPACIQQFVIPGTQLIFNNPAPQESEDCLYLNVYAPSSPAPADGRPVLFWIFGGSLQFGNAGQYSYDASSFASYEDVIVVTTNYRTNVFGFPSSPELPVTGHNLGFLDQRFALDWVQRNIEAFGGSKDKVTVFGESAGAFSIDALLTSYPANSTPPFRGAILQSGQYSYRRARTTDSVDAWNQLSAQFDCPGTYGSNLTCLRAANATQIAEYIGQKALIFSPVPDNVTLVANPAKQRLSGNVAKIPVLGGTNAQEGRVFTIGSSNTTAALISYFGNDTALNNAIEAAYPIGSPGISSTYDQIAQIYTEFGFQCSQAKWANDTASIGIPAWRYYYNASFSNTQPLPGLGLGVFHASEIQVVYGTFSNRSVTTQEYALSEAMRSAWAKFARNPLHGPGWNRVGSGTTGAVLVGASGNATGGLLTDANGVQQSGSFDLGLWGNRHDVLSSGITVIDQYEVDYRCSLFDQVYTAGQT